MILPENRLLDKKVAFLSLGCKVNTYETEAIKQQFKSYGAEICEFDEKADVYVVNTCTVTNIADRKSRQMLRRAKNLNPDAVIVATGCYVQESSEAVKEENTVDVIVGNRLKNKVASYVNEYLGGERKDVFVALSEDMTEYEDMTGLSDYHRTRVDIKIQDGCNQFCSYCIIPYARGRISSRNKSEILNEVRTLASRGYKEVVLTGIHISSYGLEDYSLKEQADLKLKNGRMPLIELMEELNAIEGIERIRTGSFEPRIITEEFVSKMAECEKVCPHFHLSLQSGCDSVLKRMNRKYTTEEYKNACDILRKYYYKPSITTDIIVGFPGETQEEFETTVNYVEEIEFAAIHIFPYSRRAGTVADRMEGQLTNSVKQDRGRLLGETESRLRKKYETSFSGDIKEILLEEIVEIDGTSYCIGHTPEYVSVICHGNEEDINKIVDVKMSDMYLNGHVFAER